jgi:hypothetical protein
MLRQVRRLLLLVAPLACAFLASSASAAPAFRDSVLQTAGARTLALDSSTQWGGSTVATDGETVKILFSDSYPVDPALALQWADFMTSLVHGSELATVTINLAPLAEVQRTCGGQALACYSPRTATIVAPGADVDAQTFAKGVLTHEYGHHVAASRLNPPFASVDYGTKRWASYENVCAKTSSGDLFPGAEDLRHYALNPGEAFAESYRVLNEQKLGLPQEPWDVVTTALYPDATALGLLEQDVSTPWTANTARKLIGTLNSKTRSRTFSVSVPYDGTLTVSPRQSRSVNVGVALLSGGSTVATTSLKRASGASLSTTVCGQRAFKVRMKLTGVVTKKTKTTVTLSVSTPG